MAKLGNGSISAELHDGAWRATASFSLLSDDGESFGTIQIGDLAEILSDEAQGALGGALVTLMEAVTAHAASRFDVTFK